MAEKKTRERKKPDAATEDAQAQPPAPVEESGDATAEAATGEAAQAAPQPAKAPKRPTRKPKAAEPASDTGADAHAAPASEPEPAAPEPVADAGEAAAPAEAPEPPGAETPAAEAPSAEPAPETSAAGTGDEQPAAETPAQAAAEASGEPAVEPAAAEEPAAEAGGGATAPQAEAGAPAEAAAPDAGAQAGEEPEAEAEPRGPRTKPAVPGAHLEVDIVPEGVDPLAAGEEYEDRYAIEDEEPAQEVGEAQEQAEEEAVLSEPIATAAIDLAAGARYRATGKRKSAIARVTLRPGSGSYLINGRALDEHFPRTTLQRNIRQPLETVGYQERMDVIARLHGGGVSAQADALRHGVSRALLEADPNLRGELKRRGFLTRDSRAKERKKAGLKKARKRPQFSKR